MKKRNINTTWHPWYYATWGDYVGVVNENGGGDTCDLCVHFKGGYRCNVGHDKSFIIDACKSFHCPDFLCYLQYVSNDEAENEHLRKMGCILKSLNFDSVHAKNADGLPR